MVGKRLSPVDSQMAVHRGPQVIRSQRTLLRLLTLRIRAANHLPRPHAATSHQHGHGLRPVIPPRLHHTRLTAHRGVDSRSPSEFPRHNQQHTLVQAPRINVLHQRRHRLVVNRESHQRVVEQVTVHRMRIPVIRAVLQPRHTRLIGILHHHRHKTATRLNQPPSQ